MWYLLNLLLDKQTSGESMYSKAIKNQSVTMHPLSCIFLGVFMIPSVSPGCFKLQSLALQIWFAVGFGCSSHSPHSLAPQQSASLNDILDPPPCIAQGDASTAAIFKAVTFQCGKMNKLSSDCFLSRLHRGYSPCLSQLCLSSTSL